MNAVCELTRFVESCLPVALEFLRQMVGINSWTNNRAGVERLARATADEFAMLGFDREFVPHQNPEWGAHLVMTREGRTPRTIALISHLDTVFPPEEEERNQFHWRAQGDRIYGPGTLDIKGGTLMMRLVLEGLRASDAQTFNDVTWLLLWNSAEETLSRHFAEVCRARFSRDTVAALVFEAEGRPRGNPAIVVARKGRATFRVTIEGRGAHAGAQHPRGANAITELARVVQRIAELTDYARALTFNVGIVNGGVAVNRVPHAAVADVEMRAFTADVYRDGLRDMLALNGPGEVASAEDRHRCQVAVRVLEESPPWPRNAGTDRLFRLWKDTATELGRPLDEQERGGLSDGNWIWDAVPTIDGLGPYGDNDHCSEWTADGSKVPEYVEVSSFVPKAVLNTLALQRLAKERTKEHGPSGPP